MSGEEIDDRILLAIVRVVEAWVEEDRAIAGLANGVLSRSERTSRAARAQTNLAEAMDALSQSLPPAVYSTLFAGLQSIKPSPSSRVGEPMRRWGQPDQRVAAARSLLKAAADGERYARERAEAERKAA